MQRGMSGYVVHRFLETFVLLNFVLIFVFLLLHLTGDPVAVMMPQDATQEDIERLRRQMGFDKPLAVQLWEFYGRVLRGDFGQSWEHGESALKVVLDRFPASLELTAAAFLISVLVGIPLGVVAAYKEDTVYDRSCMVGTVLGQAVPDFWLGLVLILVLSVWAGLLPSFGRE
ncbi:MAG: ABC transporter permease, partial [Chloroflexota bacterium]